jgi:WD40 repeat protein
MIACSPSRNGTIYFAMPEVPIRDPGNWVTLGEARSSPVSSIHDDSWTKPLRPRPTIYAGLALSMIVAAGCSSTPTHEFVVLKGHTGRIASVVFAPDGQTLASRGSDDTVKLWDVTRRRQKTSVPDFPSDMGAVAFSPDGTRWSANEASRGAIAYDTLAATNRSVYRYPERAASTWSCYAVAYGWGIAYSPDGKVLIAGGSNGGEDGFITHWNVATGEGTDWARQPSPVTAIAFSPSGKAIASGGTEGTVHLWDYATKAELARLSGHAGQITGICYSPDGAILLSSSADRTVKLWDTMDHSAITTFRRHSAPVTCVAVNHGGKLAASGDNSGTICLWDIFTRQIRIKLETKTGAVTCLAFSPTDELLASGGNDGLVRLWDIGSNPRGP